uniref:Potassium channel domain-containing protein n=1 Tax=Setaria digitata TaxID=48799 RepID=A0A915PP91_9BILA
MNNDKKRNEVKFRVNQDIQQLELSKKVKKAKVERAAGGRTIWRNIIWLIILFAYSFIGGIAFSAIEGNHDKSELLMKYRHDLDIYEKHQIIQEKTLKKLWEIDKNESYIEYKSTSKSVADNLKMQLAIDILDWYEHEIGIEIKKPVMEDSRWNIWGGVYYAASLYTTIGYGNFHPVTRAGRIISMIYAFCGIPLVFTILLEWGFLYYTWLDMFWKWFNLKLCSSSMDKHQKRRLEKERTRRAGSDLSLRLTSLGPLTQLSHTHDDLHQTDHQIESGKKISQLPIELSEAEKQRTVPLKAAFIFFFLWILISAFVVRLWETNWTYFTAYYYFFTSLTTIGLGDVVTETPNYIIFNLALTMIGLSVVGLCVSIVQAKIRLIFDRMIRSIDSQYRIRQIDPDVATMTVIPDEKEGIKRLCEAQPIQDRLIYIAMDEHKKQLLEDRWRQRSSMINRITQTWPNRADKCIQTGQRVDEQPPVRPERYDDDWESGSSTLSDEDVIDYDPVTGKRIAPPSTRRYIYTVFD